MGNIDNEVIHGTLGLSNVFNKRLRTCSDLFGFKYGKSVIPGIHVLIPTCLNYQNYCLKMDTLENC